MKRIPWLTVGAYLLSLGTAVWAYRHECPPVPQIYVSVPVVPQCRFNPVFGIEMCDNDTIGFSPESVVQELVYRTGLHATRERVAGFAPQEQK